MVEFRIDNIFAEIEGTFCNKSSASLWERSVPLSSRIFSYAHIVYTLTYKRQNNTEAKAFNLTFRYIDDALSIITGVVLCIGVELHCTGDKLPGTTYNSLT